MNREALIAAMQLTAAEKVSPIEVPVWGTVYVRSLTVAEVEDQAADTADKKDTHRLARAAARLMCDEAGVRLFNHEDEADVSLLAGQPWHLLQKVLAASDDLIKGTDEGN